MTPKRIIYIALLGLTIGLGLLSRSSLFAEDTPIQQYAGDALWAMAVFWSLGILFPRTTTLHYAIGALVISLAVETSQLYHAPWVDYLRSFRLVALLLGHTFIWADLACYAAGVWFAANIDHFLIRNELQSPWSWWRESTIKDKFIVLGCLGIAMNTLSFLLGRVHIRSLTISTGFLFIGFMMRSEDSTDIKRI